MARDGHAPRRFLHMGDRLAFSNGLVALALTAAVVFVAFGGHTERLIPLYAVGVFLAFTLSQTGMVVHRRRRRGGVAPPARRQRSRRGAVRAGAADRGGRQVHRGRLGGGARRTAAGAVVPPDPRPLRTAAPRAGAAPAAVRAARRVRRTAPAGTPPGDRAGGG
ncbi:hypothetical protein V2I01_18285 [Micromonospora sp. BRA006-A]|nr:hypothetical protein [Micromonospora sp. BRA006-A]